MGVVGGVDEHHRITQHTLHARRHLHLREALAHRIHIQRVLAGHAEETLHRSQRHRSVLCLVCAGKRQENVVVDSAKALQRQLLAADGDGGVVDSKVAPLSRHRSAGFHRALQDDLHRLRLLLSNDGDVFRRSVAVALTRLDDAGLVRGDLLNRLAEETLVVDTDRGDDGHVRLHHVRRIPGAAHADLDDRNIHGCVRERRVRNADEQLETAHLRLAALAEVRVHHVHVRLNVAPDIHETGLGNFLPVDEDALGDTLQLRRGEQPRATVQRAKDRLRHTRRRRLAVRARNVNNVEGLLGRTQKIHQHRNAVQRRVRVIRRRTRIQLGDHLVKVRVVALRSQGWCRLVGIGVGAVRATFGRHVGQVERDAVIGHLQVAEVGVTAGFEVGDVDALEGVVAKLCSKCLVRCPRFRVERLIRHYFSASRRAVTRSNSSCATF